MAAVSAVAVFYMVAEVDWEEKAATQCQSLALRKARDSSLESSG